VAQEAECVERGEKVAGCQCECIKNAEWWVAVQVNGRYISAAEVKLTIARPQ
jgi:hypothetical protein